MKNLRSLSRSPHSILGVFSENPTAENSVDGSSLAPPEVRPVLGITVVQEL